LLRLKALPLLIDQALQPLARATVAEEEGDGAEGHLCPTTADVMKIASANSRGCAAKKA
jgi:hypothetical protein